MTLSGQSEPRARCDRCRKPASLCLCNRTVRVQNRTHILVVQHRRERSHPVGTARIVRLGLSATDLVETTRCLPRPALRPGAALLFPGPESRELTSLSAEERPDQLVVLDGTWHQARRLFLDNPWIQELPRVRLAPAAPSRYRIRRQPAEHCVSTLESIVAALRILEGDTAGLNGLLDVFDTMIDEQHAFMVGPRRAPRPRRHATRPSRAIPDALREAPERVVAVYAETVAREANEGCGPRRLLRWSAVRPVDGSTFDCVLGPLENPAAAGHLRHIGLGPADIAAAINPEDAGGAWRAFVNDDDLIVGWHPALMGILKWLDDAPLESVALRGVWANITHRRPGGLDALVTALGLPIEDVPIPGRASVRLGQTLAILRHMVSVAPREVRT